MSKLSVYIICISVHSAQCISIQKLKKGDSFQILLCIVSACRACVFTYASITKALQDVL